MRRALMALLACCCAVLAVPPAPVSAESGPQIDHLVVIMEENATFDSTFGTLRGVDGVHVGQRVGLAGGESARLRGFSSLGPRAFKVSTGEEVLSNGPQAARIAFDRGAMDGFKIAQRVAHKNSRLPFTLIDRETPSPWRKLARRGVVFDRYFSSYLAGSLPNTLSLVAGDAYGREQGTSQDFTSLWNSDIPTVFDRATQAGVSWKYYVGGLEQIDQAKVADGAYARSKDATPSALYWAPILSMQRFWTDPALAQNVRPQADLFADAASGSLPAITYVLPQPTTHEPSVVGPDLRLLSILNALQTSPTWSTTAVLVVWDDWGGYYDHVMPPTADDGHRLGMRVPMLLLSPWAQGGTVSSQTLDHSSIPALATSLFGLDPITPHTAVPEGLWLDAPVVQPRIEALSHAPRYEAAGMSHARSVFQLYLLTMLVIVGVLGVLGFSMLRRPTRGGS
ncbi:MAG: alkaline phosphatase family protein [Actinomycetota bacterium]